MKIVFITGWFTDAASGSGASLFIKNLRDGLQKRGIAVQMITPQFSIFRSYLLATLFRVVKNLLLFVGLKNDYDVIVCFDYDGFALANRSRAPVICCPRGILKEVAETEYGIYKTLLSIQGFFEQVNLSRADMVIVPSLYAEKSVQKYYRVPREKISVIYNGINSHLLSDVHEQSKRDGIFRIIAVGKMYPRKNTLLLLRAFDVLHKILPHTELNVVGDGIEFAKALRLRNSLPSKGSIHFHGFVGDYETLRKKYLDSNILLHLSVQETFGNVILEAMANAKPAVVFNRASLPEIVRNDYNGLVLEEEDPVYVAEKVKSLILDRKKMKILSMNALATAKEFSQEKTIDAFQKKFLEVIHAKKH